MQKIQEVNPGARIRVQSDKPFTCYLEKAKQNENPDDPVTLFVGPLRGDLRKTSFRVPDGYGVCIVECDADSLTTIDVMPNLPQHLPAEGLVAALETDRPLPMKDVIANEIARILHARGEIDEDPETIEEANDFDLDDLTFDDDEWAQLYHLVRDEELALIEDEEDESPPAGGSPGEPPEEAAEGEVVNS